MSNKLAQNTTLARVATATETLAQKATEYVNITITMQGNDTPATPVTQEKLVVTNPTTGVTIYKADYVGTPVTIQMLKGTTYKITGTVDNAATIGMYLPTTIIGMADSNKSVTITYEVISAITSLSVLSALIQAHPGVEILPIGTEITIPYTYSDTAAHNVNWPFHIINWRYANCKNPSTGQIESKWGCDLLAQLCGPYTCQFDAQEGTVITAATHGETALAGEYYYATGSDDTTTYPNGWLTIATGGIIPFEHYTTIKVLAFKDTGIMNYGYNNYSKSAIRQYINSTKGINLWWQPTHVGDNAPSQLSAYPGLLSGFRSMDIDAMQYVAIDNKCNTGIDQGATTLVYDRMYLPSAEEVYGIVNTEGQLPETYWHDFRGLESQSNSATTLRRFGKVGATTSYQYCWLRSAHRGNSYYTWFLNSSGTLSRNRASDSSGVLPACFIA